MQHGYYIISWKTMRELLHSSKNTRLYHEIACNHPSFLLTGNWHKITDQDKTYYTYYTSTQGLADYKLKLVSTGTIYNILISPINRLQCFQSVADWNEKPRNNIWIPQGILRLERTVAMVHPTWSNVYIPTWKCPGKCDCFCACNMSTMNWNTPKV